MYASTPTSLMFQIKTIAATYECSGSGVRIPCNYNGKIGNIRMYWSDDNGYCVDCDDFMDICGEDWDAVEERYNSSLIF